MEKRASNGGNPTMTHLRKVLPVALLTALVAVTPAASAACSLVGACASAFPLQSGFFSWINNRWEPLHVAGMGTHSANSPATGTVSISLSGASGACSITGLLGGSCTSNTPTVTYATFPPGISWCATAQTTPTVGLFASETRCTST
jgi:hypothetical protein